MLQVMLVDDKQSVVDGLACYINWNEFGFEIVEKTTDVFFAIETAKKQQIDVIITDIRMPDMTGFEMISEISTVLPMCKYILLSGYSEFEYAKKAIEKNASGYLLKPVDSDELINLLIKVKKEIEEEKADMKKKTEEYIRSVLHGDTTKRNDYSELKTNNGFRYICVRQKSHLNVETDVADMELALSWDELYGNRYWIVEKTNGVIGIVIDSVKSPKNTVQIKQTLKSKLNKVKNIDCVIYIGKEVLDINDISYSKKSIKKLEYASFYECLKNVFLFEDYESMEYTEDVYDISVTGMFEAVIILDKRKFSDSLDGLKKKIVERRLYPEIAIGFFNKFIYDVVDYVNKNNGNSISILNQWSFVQNTADLSIDKLCDFIISLWKIIYFESQKDEKFDNENVIEEIIEYINRNYANADLSLQDVSKEYFITPAYLGKLFKLKTGESFRTHLLKIRFEKAKALLINSEYPVYKIANKVGFTDGTYFISKFKEMEGITPEKYRKIVKDGANQDDGTLN